MQVNYVHIMYTFSILGMIQQYSNKREEGCGRTDEVTTF